MIYLNEWDAFPAQWLRNQFPDAVVDETSIVALNRPADEYGPYTWGVPVDQDLSQYRQVHFFAGIGGWPEALRLAGWPESVPIWTGSCPCQPFSSAGDQKGFSDDRDLWPDMFRQIRRFRPAFVVGEQVANGTLPLAWLDRVFSDLESEGYTCWACDLPAASVGSPIIRQRLFWGAVRTGEWAKPGSGQWGRTGDVSRTDSERPRDGAVLRQGRGQSEAVGSSGTGDVRSSRGERWDTSGTDHREHDGRQPAAANGCSPLTVPGSAGSRLSGGQDAGAGAGDAGTQRGGSFEPERSRDAGDLPGSEGGGQRRGTGAGGSDGPQAGHGGSSGVELERSPSDGRQPRRAPSDGRLAPRRCGSVRDVALPDGVQLQGQPPTGEQPVLEQGAGTDEPSGRPCLFCGYSFDQDACGVHGCPNCLREGLEYQLVGGSDDTGLQGLGWDDGAEAEEFADEGSAGSAASSGVVGYWDRFSIIRFTDGKQRRIEPGTEPLAHGIPKGNSWAVPWLAQLGFAANHAKQLVAIARTNRVGTLRGYGNAIVPQAAAVFLRVWMEVLGIGQGGAQQGQAGPDND